MTRSGDEIELNSLRAPQGEQIAVGGEQDDSVGNWVGPGHAVLVGCVCPVEDMVTVGVKHVLQAEVGFAGLAVGRTNDHVKPIPLSLPEVEHVEAVGDPVVAELDVVGVRALAADGDAVERKIGSKAGCIEVECVVPSGQPWLQ